MPVHATSRGTHGPDFDEVSKRYYERLNQVVAEEHVVHRLDNWILDQVLSA